MQFCSEPLDFQSFIPEFTYESIEDFFDDEEDKNEILSSKLCLLEAGEHENLWIGNDKDISIKEGDLVVKEELTRPLELTRINSQTA